MNRQVDYFKQAELALATYASLLTEIPDPDELKRVDFSDSQATNFSNTYRVVTQYNDPAIGLSATVFADNVTEETFLAIRGTEITDPGDIFAGLPIAIFGTTVLQPQYASLKTQVQAWLSDGTLKPTFTVTGHSLGGFLATGLVDDPAFASHISHAYLYNAPGTGGIVGSFADTLLGFMGLSPLGDSSKISNIEAAIGANPIAGLGFNAAPPIDIIIENQTQISGSPPSKNHSQQALTDALAAYNAYSKLTPSLAQSQLNDLIDAFGTTENITSNGRTLESALDALYFIASTDNETKMKIEWRLAA
ncbi:hypothetical protein W03_19590 [Nitrosomonas sp. PY1]|uniref:hypothetical protein n=1 Tax=Nitrosomonas sp. PY1 TaxID=1803906 RepID=UPI001FC8655D|nr:hypothetical protein [Nitrosomonas sp. PY1]GKS69955.1 hypothetical protein W03_19590 [Nitrosomonas sp. PY1]